MRQGLFPGHQKALVELARKGLRSEQRSRRMMLGWAGACSLAAVGSFFLGRKLGAPPTDRAATPLADDPRLGWARRLAAGPLAELESAYPSFLLVFERAPADPGLLVGVARLVDLAETRGDRALARHLVQSTAAPVGGLQLAVLRSRLTALVR